MAVDLRCSSVIITTKGGEHRIFFSEKWFSITKRENNLKNYFVNNIRPAKGCTCLFENYDVDHLNVHCESFQVLHHLSDIRATFDDISWTASTILPNI